MKCLAFHIPEGLPEQGLLHYTIHSYPEIPPYMLKGAFAKRDVKMNGIRCGKNAAALGGSDVLIYLPDYRERTIPILYRDEHLLILHKPGGLPCETRIAGERTVSDLLQSQLAPSNIPLLAHRLDAATEGLLILALDEATLEALQDSFRQRQIQKEYLCLVKGAPSPSSAILTAYLSKDAFHGKVSVTDRAKPGAKEIITEYELIRKGEISLLRITLHTGRTHQIRSHLSHIGHPVLGDDLYGDRAFNKAMKYRKLALCSYRLSFHTTGLLAYLDGRSFETTPSFVKNIS